MQVRYGPESRRMNKAIYSRRYIRHPGYLGFMVWSVGCQILLVNPFCLVAFTVLVRCVGA